ncbi:CCR4-NOT transcription complex subunit 11, partial [Dispira parvispora]
HGVLQLNFIPDHSKLVLQDRGQTITYIAQGKVKSYSLDEVHTLVEDTELLKRLKYAKDVLSLINTRRTVLVDIPTLTMALDSSPFTTQCSALTFELESSIDGLYNELDGIERAFETALAELLASSPTKLSPGPPGVIQTPAPSFPCANLENDQNADLFNALETLVTKGTERPLNVNDCERLQTVLVESPRWVDKLFKEPNVFQRFFDNNTRLVKETLAQFAQTNHFPMFLAVWSESTRITLDLLEIITWLATHGHLTDERMHMFVARCFQCCDRAVDRDAQNRQVKLVSLFLKNLLRAEVIQEEDYFAEINTFCIAYARVREATDLFRMILEWKNKSNVM